MSSITSPLFTLQKNARGLKRRFQFISYVFFAFAALSSAQIVTAQEQAIESKIAIHSQLLDGDSKNNLMIVVGERGHILYSEDDGQNWQQGKVPSRALLTGVFMHDEKLAWAVGHDATILRSRDGGKHWQRVYYDPDMESPLLDVWFKDEHSGYAIGAYGLFLETQDGGDSWTQRWINEEDDFHLNHITQLNEHQLFIAAEAGMTYRSNDLGATWESLASPYHGSYFGSQVFANNKLVLFGLRGHLFMSTDQGDTWVSQNTNTSAMLTSAIKTRDNLCLVSGRWCTFDQQTMRRPAIHPAFFCQSQCFFRNAGNPTRRYSFNR